MHERSKSILYNSFDTFRCQKGPSGLLGPILKSLSLLMTHGKDKQIDRAGKDDSVFPSLP